MKEIPRDIVFTIDHWYDGALEGLAHFQGKLHYYECHWRDWQEIAAEWLAHYWLTPLDPDACCLAQEMLALEEGWREAFRTGATTEATRPLLPQDRARHEEISQLLQQKPADPPDSRLNVKGVFYYGPQVFVEWTLLE
jgi:hypothetical protein